MAGSPARIGTLAALATLVADQATKLGLLFGLDLPARGPIQLGPFVTIVADWNKGISYGLFQQHTDLGRWLLVGVSAAACVALGVWINRAGNALLGLALGLIAGGAAGNLIDRAAYGAVFDFVYLHAGSFSWYVFNVADAAIVAGVVGLFYDSIVLERRAKTPAGSGPKSRAVTGMPE